MIVNYDDIEKAISDLEADLTKHEQAFAENQPIFLELLQTQTFPLLEKEQRELVLFISTVLYLAVSQKINANPEYDLEAFLDAEENNWNLKEKSTDWANCLDNYFKDYPEEDLLAFVEDMTSKDEGK